MTPGPVFALVTGGGTGGHVTPALAIADALVTRGHDRASIRFVGAARGLEANAVPDAGYEIELLALDGIQRSISPRAVLRSVRAVAAFVVASLRCLALVGRTRPAVVVGVGGYASAPLVLAARLRRVPTVVHEQNAVPGLVNRLAVRIGAHPAVSFAVADWPDAVDTGNPVRQTVRDVVREPVTPPLVAIFGGSQGAGRLNDLGLDLYDRWRDRDDIAVRHVAGPRHHGACIARLADLRRPDDRLRYEVVDFERDMAALYAAATLVVCRSGATTIAEVNVVGLPAVYVPWSGAAQDQQTANARAMVKAGAAELVSDADCDLVHVAPRVEALLADTDRRRAMATAAGTAGRPDAGDRIVDLIESSVGG
ncbi:MAG: UDP-N-acetylglucosamine--N-acetylmuramyl-(pentapeptide) pyrophosphoryl-undecaprenol N-acetylglucosamine transferase [Acidimicrobiia bacterium]